MYRTLMMITVLVSGLFVADAIARGGGHGGYGMHGGGHGGHGMHGGGHGGHGMHGHGGRGYGRGAYGGRGYWGANGAWIAAPLIGAGLVGAAAYDNDDVIVGYDQYGNPIYR